MTEPTTPVPAANLATMQANPVPNGPFGRPAQTSGVMRAYKPATGAGKDGYGSPFSGPMNIAPAGRGLHAVEYAKQAGHSLRLAFPVDGSNRLADFFKLIKETNGTTKTPVLAKITSDFEGTHLIHSYDEKATVTDNPFGWYVAYGNPHNAATVALPIQPAPGLYYIWLDTPDGSAAKIPVAHSGSN